MNTQEKNVEKCKFLSEYNPSKGGQLSEEQFVPANSNELKLAMEQNRELYTLLNTPAKDLPEHYRFLVDEIIDNNGNTTLYDMIELSLHWSMRGTKTIPYFSKSGNRINGFAAYIVRRNNNEVIEIKIFTFNPSQGSGAVLISDLMRLLDELVIKHNKVSWSAMKENPANRIYQKAIEKYGGSIKEDSGMIEYCIEGEKV